jgi:hypothetical protein
MQGLDNHYRTQLAQYQATIDANQEPEPYTPTHMEKAFMRSYASCVAVASKCDVEYFLENKDRAQGVDYYEEKKIADEIEYWSHIEDAWLMWLDAIQYARSAK